MKILILSISLFFFFFLFFSSKSSACLCQKKPSVKNQVKTSEIVVVGTVISKEIIMLEGRVDNLPYKMQQVLYKVQVLEKHKGLFTADTVTIQTALENDNCGFDFKVGTKYIIYSSKDQFTKPGNFSTSICTRTRKYACLENARIKSKIKR